MSAEETPYRRPIVMTWMQGNGLEPHEMLRLGTIEDLAKCMRQGAITGHEDNEEPCHVYAHVWDGSLKEIVPQTKTERSEGGDHDMTTVTLVFPDHHRETTTYSLYADR